MKLFYTNLKLRKDTALIPIVLKRLLLFNDYVKAYDLIKTQKIIQITAETLILIGNAYFEIGKIKITILRVDVSGNSVLLRMPPIDSLDWSFPSIR
jgi:hypothetical protein